MMAGLGSLQVSSVNANEATRSAPRSRQGATPSEARQSMAVEAKANPAADAERLAALAEQMNDTLRRGDGKFSVSVDNATGRMVVRITDTATGEVVKQVPPQQILDASVSVEKIIGLLVNDQG